MKNEQKKTDQKFIRRMSILNRMVNKKNIGVYQQGILFGHENFWKKEKIANFQVCANQ